MASPSRPHWTSWLKKPRPLGPPSCCDNISLASSVSFRFFSYSFYSQKSATFDPEAPSSSSTNGDPAPALANQDEANDDDESRQQWGKPVEFLLSCIAMSVGLGNVWRFPFTAYENGGGAFIIPYLTVLLLIGRPLYFMEMAMGQFASKSSVKVWDMVPGARGNWQLITIIY